MFCSPPLKAGAVSPKSKAARVNRSGASQDLDPPRPSVAPAVHRASRSTCLGLLRPSRVERWDRFAAPYRAGEEAKLSDCPTISFPECRPRSARNSGWGTGNTVAGTTTATAARRSARTSEKRRAIRRRNRLPGHGLAEPRSKPRPLTGAWEFHSGCGARHSSVSIMSHICRHHRIPVKTDTMTFSRARAELW
jgi:hypothetical protein